MNEQWIGSSQGLSQFPTDMVAPNLRVSAAAIFAKIMFLMDDFPDPMEGESISDGSDPGDKETERYLTFP
jgi:hypothetical protein